MELCSASEPERIEELADISGSRSSARLVQLGHRPWLGFCKSLMPSARSGVGSTKASGWHRLMREGPRTVGARVLRTGVSHRLSCFLLANIG